jgi:nucleoid-associated protein YgaU
MTRYGHNVEFQQQGPFPQGGDERRQEQGGYQQGGYQQNDRQQYGQQQGGYQQGGQQQGRHQQGHGEAQSYYSESQQSQQPQYPPSGPGQHQQGSPYGSGPRDQFNEGDGQDGERGFMGAVAGGAAGAFGGHKIGGATGHSKSSTLIGALAGAFSGHKLQDAAEDWKDDRDEKKEEEKRKEEEEKRRKEEKKRREEEEKNRRDDDRHSSHHRRRSSSRRRRSRSSSRGSNRRRSGHYAGNFTASSRDIRLDAHGEYVLHASCKRENGDYQHTSISLNKLLENDRGSFRWSAGGHHGGSSQVTVQHGDTLRSIAARFNTSFEEIARQNNISNPDLIYPGQTLQVPGGGSQGGGGFGNSARNVRLVDGGQRLEGELSRDGDWVLSSIILDERIKNFNGTLELV